MILSKRQEIAAIIGDEFFDFYTEEDATFTLEQHAKTRTAEIELIKSDLLDIYVPIIGWAAIDLICNYKQGITLNDLLDELNNEVRNIE